MTQVLQVCHMHGSCHPLFPRVDRWWLTKVFCLAVTVLHFLRTFWRDFANCCRHRPAVNRRMTRWRLIDDHVTIQHTTEFDRYQRNIAIRSVVSWSRLLFRDNPTMVAKDTVITLKGSVEIISEFFFTAINSILYQRGEGSRERLPKIRLKYNHCFDHMVKWLNNGVPSLSISTFRQESTNQKRSRENRNTDWPSSLPPTKV